MTILEADSELRMAYDTELYNDSLYGMSSLHDVGEEGIAMTDFENPVKGSLYSIWWDTYLRYNIFREIGETFREFLDRPRWEALEILNRLRSKENVARTAMNKFQDEMDELAGKK